MHKITVLAGKFMLVCWGMCMLGGVGAGDDFHFAFVLCNVPGISVQRGQFESLKYLVLEFNLLLK